MNYRYPSNGKLTGADRIVSRMRCHGVDRLFLFPGGTIAPILDAAQRNGIELVVPRHEQGAGYMALADARIHGRVAILMATSGPGATNLVTPVADAFYDSIPLVVITGQVGTGDLKRPSSLRQRGFQETDTMGIFAPITKARFQPRSADELNGILNEAFFIAMEGRRGPVLIDMPMDVQRALVTEIDLSAPLVVPRPGASPSDETVISFAKALSEAKRPVIIAGAGVLASDAHGELRALMEAGQIPVTCSLAGLGAVPTDHALSLGFHGHTGNRASGLAIQNADVLLVVGSRLDVRQTGTETDKFALGARILRIDVDADEIQHPRVRIDATLRSDAKIALESIRQSLKSIGSVNRASWLRQIEEWKREHRLDCQSLPGTLRPQSVIDEFSRRTAASPVVCVTGVGSHQQWTARHFSLCHPERRWMSSCGHGTMGYDLPTAAGAALSLPGTRVLCFVGDGSALMNIQELAVIAEMDAPVTVVVLDNKRLGIVSQFQRLNWGDDPTCGVHKNPDFAAIARGFGIRASTVSDLSGLSASVEQALSDSKPYLLHALVNTNEDVVPMLLAGQTLDAMWPS